MPDNCAAAINPPLRQWCAALPLAHRSSSIHRRAPKKTRACPLSPSAPSPQRPFSLLLAPASRGSYVFFRRKQVVVVVQRARHVVSRAGRVPGPKMQTSPPCSSIEGAVISLRLSALETFPDTGVPLRTAPLVLSDYPSRQWHRSGVGLPERAAPPHIYFFCACTTHGVVPRRPFPSSVAAPAKQFQKASPFQLSRCCVVVTQDARPLGGPIPRVAVGEIPPCRNASFSLVMFYAHACWLVRCASAGGKLFVKL